MYAARGLNSFCCRIDDLRTAISAITTHKNVRIVAHETRAVEAQPERFRDVFARRLAECAKDGIALDDVRAPGNFLERTLAVSPRACGTDLAARAFESRHAIRAEHALRDGVEPE